MRRKTRPRVVWLPGDPFFSADAATLGHSTVNVATDSLTQTSVGDTITTIAPCVLDKGPISILTPGTTLADIEQSGYRLRRIVGKIWPVAHQIVGNDDGGSAVATAGFIILRTDTGGLPLSPANLDTYNAAIVENQGDPWIWRRSWMVINFNSTSQPPGNGFGMVGPNNAQGGVMDGPHIDAKTARLVGPEERLFLVLTLTGLGIGDPQTPLLVDWIWDCRYLASMRSSLGNRRNASR